MTTENTNGHKASADPILVEIVRNGVMAVTEEMKTNLMRTAYNMIIYEALDFTVGIFTKNGDTVSIGLGLPMFIRGMSETVKAKIRHFEKEGFQPGDILLTNDAYITGSHLNHLTFTVPVFHEGELVGFSCCMAHWPDVGGTLGGVTTDIFSEGLQIPIVKYAARRCGQSGDPRNHPPQCAFAGTRDGRPARADHGDQDRRAPVPRTAESVWPADGARLHRRGDGSGGGGGARAHPRHSGRRLCGRKLHGRRRGRHRAARSDPGQGHRRRRRSDRGPDRCRKAGEGLLQFRLRRPASPARRSRSNA